MFFEKEYCLGLDISTKTIGVTLMDITGKLIDISHISLPATSKKNGVITIYDRADYFKKAIEYYKNFNIKYIFVEEPLKNGPNINTTILLAKFNGIVSQAMYEMFKVTPEHITVYDARFIFFPEFVRTDTKKKKNGIVETKEVLSFPKDADKKKLVYDKVSWLEPQVNWCYSKYLNLKTENFDRADSYVVAKAGLYLNKFINFIPKCDKIL